MQVATTLVVALHGHPRVVVLVELRRSGDGEQVEDDHRRAAVPQSEAVRVRLMLALWEQSPLSATDVARLLQLDLATASPLIKRLDLTLEEVQALHVALTPLIAKSRMAQTLAGRGLGERPATATTSARAALR